MIRIYDHSKKITDLSLSNVYQDKYNHMEYVFINKYSKHLKRTIMPLTLYSNHYGDLYGLSMILDGYRVNLNKDIMFFIRYDKLLKNNDGSDLECNLTIFESVIKKTCRMPNSYVLTGFKFNNVFNDQPIDYNINLKCNENNLYNSKFNSGDFIKNSSNEDNHLKFSHENGFYRVFNHKNCNDTLEITIDDPPQNLEIDFIGYTKFTGPGDPLERDDILKHFILLWPNDDMTSYIALSEALFNRAIKLDLDASKDLVSILEMIE